MAVESITLTEARRLALVVAGLLRPQLTGLPAAVRDAKQAQSAALAVIGRFGYLQLDPLSITGARTQSIVLLSRLAGLSPTIADDLLRPGQPLFEYYGHEACWMPIDLYPAFEFRRRRAHVSRWSGRLLREHARVRAEILRRVAGDGPLRSIDLEGHGEIDGEQVKVARYVAGALWMTGELAVRERLGSHRVFDLAERVIPEQWRADPLELGEALPILLGRALAGHGWASTTTLAQTFRLRNARTEVTAALQAMREANLVVACDLVDGRERASGWIRPADLELAASLARLRPRADQGVLLSPFDPILWDRARVRQLFGFDQILEVYKPAAERVYGYYCLPVLAGERLIARVDLRADRAAGRLGVLSLRFEGDNPKRPAQAVDRAAADAAVARFATALGLAPDYAPKPTAPKPRQGRRGW